MNAMSRMSVLHVLLSRCVCSSVFNKFNLIDFEYFLALDQMSSIEHGGTKTFSFLMVMLALQNAYLLLC